MRDSYDLPVSTREPVACDAYVQAVARFLAAGPGVEAALDRALAADPDFALAHMARARTEQMLGRSAQARASATRAVELAASASPREQGHVRALERVVAGDRAGALAAIEVHLADYPRDVMVLAPAAGVFGLFGFSGESGREQALLAFLQRHGGALGDDWWFLAALAFAQGEVGQLDIARANVERALTLCPRNANAAHIRAHVHYEAGEAAAGLDWLRGWFADYDRSGAMHCHLGWHIALWQLELGDAAAAWRTYDALVHPEDASGRGSWGPPLNALTDGVSFLFRAELAGGARDPERWAELAAFARRTYPNPGLAFADMHSALASAMTGDREALAAIVAEAKGPAADMVVTLARGFDAFVQGNWSEAVGALQAASISHERIGGSRAQRDLIEQALRVAALHAGRPDLVAERRRGVH